MTDVLTPFWPRGGCADIHNYRGPEVVLSGPAGTGKSRACLEKVHAVMASNPNARALIVRKTAVSMASTILNEFETSVIGRWLASGEVTWFGGSQREPAQYRYRNGSRILIAGMDRPTKIMSSQFDLVYVNEATELAENDWEMLTTRLRNRVVPFQQILADCNPDTPTHWLKQRADRGGMVMLESRHRDNPTLFTLDGRPTASGAEYLAVLDALTSVRRARLRDGKWVAAEGIIWDGFDMSIHAVDPLWIPKDWPRFWSVDFGYTNPFVCQRWAQDPDGRLWLYGETYRTGMLVEDHARELKALITPAGKDGVLKEPRPRAVICDHDAEDRATLERHLGISTVAAKKNVSEGLQAVASRMKVAGDGKPRLFLMRDAVARRDQTLVDAKKPASTLEEVPGYIWANHATKEAPLKEDDHGCDAMRYLVAHVDLGGRYRVRSVTY